MTDLLDTRVSKGTGQVLDHTDEGNQEILQGEYGIIS